MASRTSTPEHGPSIGQWFVLGMIAGLAVNFVRRPGATIVFLCLVLFFAAGLVYVYWWQILLLVAAILVVRELLRYARQRLAARREWPGPPHPH